MMMKTAEMTTYKEVYTPLAFDFDEQAVVEDDFNGDVQSFSLMENLQIGAVIDTIRSGSILVGEYCCIVRDFVIEEIFNNKITSDQLSMDL